MDDSDDGSDYDAIISEEGSASSVHPAKPSQSSKAPPGPSHPRTQISTPQSILPSDNTFSLQLSALISSTILPQTQSLKSLLSKIHDIILSLPSLPVVSPERAIRRLGKMTMPPVAPDEFVAKDVKWGLGWETPVEILLGGSWSVCGGYKTAKGEMGDVDLVLIMPESLFTPKDRLDYRYLHKRVHYLVVIAKELSRLCSIESPLMGGKLSWGYASGDHRRPTVQLSVGKEQGLKYTTTINIHAGVPSTLFPPHTLSPTKCLLRHPSLLENPTTSYSTSIALDTLHKSHLLHLHRLSQHLPEGTLASFLAAWRIWARRRGISREKGGSGWFAGVLLGWIVNGGEIGGQGGQREKTRKYKGLGKGLHHWEALRAAWEFIASTDFEKTPVFCATEVESSIPQADFLKAFNGPIFVDPTGMVNVFSGWEKGQLDLLRHYARETLGVLEDGTDSFDEVFLSDRKMGMAKFDEFIRVDVTGFTLETTLAEQCSHPDTLDLYSYSVAAILRRGLTDRARLVYVAPSSDTTLDVGLTYNPTSATRVLDVGPPSTDEAACQSFRQLWGSKAELRRFKDGSISESVMWEISRPEEAALIPFRAISHLLNTHFHLSQTNITPLSSNPEWLSIVQIPNSAREVVSLEGSEKLGFRPILDGYDILYKSLKSIDTELPLSILHVTPTSELLRYSSTFVPHPIDVARHGHSPDRVKYIPLADVVMQFESSPRWPEDLAAVQKVKLAMFEKLARILQSSIPRSRLNVAFEPDCSDIEDYASLEILLPQGVAFRIHIFHDKEKFLLERALEPPKPIHMLGTQLPQPPRKLVIPALEKHLIRFHYKSEHHQAFAPLHHRFPSFSSSTRLLRRWLSSHLLSPHIPSETVELLMASVYLDPSSLGTPASSTKGFINALIKLGEWDWRKEPLFVPLSTEIHSTDRDGRVKFPEELKKEALENFTQLRNRDEEVHLGAWVIVTSMDIEGMRWTKERPGRVVAGRIGVLARAALDELRIAEEKRVLNVKNLFTTPLDQYDFLIHLKPSLVPTYAQAVRCEEEQWETSSSKFRNAPVIQGVYGSELRLGFDPMSEFVKDIQRLYGDTLLVFHDPHGGTVIACVWNPIKEQPRSLKPLLGYSTKPIVSSTLVTINKEAIIAEISRLGQGLIERIERPRR
ncbi:hypothetical protein M231_03297 [Tremella mesenterica]|uniref:U3 small nucleolar RNA-associated protein 22 n=1 Tax=Tremella mesenterica TaxID=5217 RepID=A0A4Q1BNM6_TREME|nr:hypothetical protein M231_03297 [Tremella mesenterica]